MMQMKSIVPDLKKWAIILFLFFYSASFHAFCSINSNFLLPSEKSKPLIITLNFSFSDYNGFGVSCNSSSDGSIDLTPADGTAPYTFIWSTGDVTEDLNALPAGIYTVTVTDFTGLTQSASVTITAPPVLTILQDSIRNAKCNGGSGGVAFISVSGGALGYSYLWSNGSNAQDLTGVLAGTYSVTVTDQNNCQQQGTFVIGENPAVNLSSSVTDVLCNGASTGAIDLTVTGGTPGFVYNWSNGSGSEDPAALSAGTYTVTVTDVTGCTESASAIISQPSAISISLLTSDVICNGAATGAIDLTVSGGNPGYTYNWSNGSTTQDLSGVGAASYTVTVTDLNNCTKVTSTQILQPSAIILSTLVTNVACNGASSGSIDLTVSGGTPGYTYSWSNGSTVQDISGIASATYSVTVTDANSCTATTNALVAQPSAISTSTSVTNVTCNGASTGAIDLTVGGGSPGYLYSWSNGSSSQDISTLISGTYTVTVSDANGCTALTSAFVSQPAVLNLSSIVTNVLCNGASTGAVDVSVGGGSPGYSYNWSNGSTSQDISALPAGTFTVTVTDVNACTASITAVVNQNAPIVLNFIPVSGTCNAANGSVTVIPSGGNPNYTYLWSNGQTTQVISGLAAATYTVTVTDASACSVSGNTPVGNAGSPLATLVTFVNVLCAGGANGSLDISVSGGAPNYSYLWSNGATTQDISGLIAGNYSVTVTDQNFCARSFVFTIIQPQAISAPGIVSNVLCRGGNSGAINITTGGGTPSYTYLWSNGSTTEDVSGLLAGTFTVTVTDGNGCTFQNNYVVSQPATALSLSTGSTQSGCGAGTGTATASPSGGTPGYTYLWSNGSTTSTISNLSPATYTVTVSDANNCTVTGSVAVAAANAPVISSSSLTAVTCNGGNNGAISISTTGGTPVITYLWSNGATTQNVSGLIAGTYTVTVSDANSCSVSSSFVITQSSAVASTASITNVQCNGAATGSIDIAPSGGNGVYTYLWSTGALVQDVNGLLAGIYSVTITDGNNCTGSSQYTVGQVAIISFGPVVTDNTCNGTSAGSIDLNMTGGTPPFTFLWSNGFTGEDPVNLAAGTYTVTATDINGCTRSRNIYVDQPPAISANVNTTVATCAAANGTATVVASGGTGTLTYLWSTGSTTASIGALVAGTYTVTVSDANLCTRIVTGVVSSPNAPVISAASIDSVSCNGNSDGAISLTITGGTFPLTFLWSNGVLTKNNFGLLAGTYTITVTDQNNCTTSGVYTVNEPDTLLASFSAVPAACGLPNGTLSVSVSGGVPGYSYLWSNGNVSNAISNVIAGVYSVTVTDANSCTARFTSTLTGTSGPVVDSSRVQKTLCNGDSTGAVTIFISQGAIPYTFLWSNGLTSQNISGIPAGSYTVTITDAATCTETKSFVVTQPSVILAPIVTQPSFCGQATGQAQVNPSGGTPPYTYLWTTGQTTQTITSLTAGTYAVTVTDANGCTRRRNGGVSLLNGPVIVLDSLKEVTCPGANNGAVFISVSGGITPYVYQWSSGSTLQDVSNLSAGIYTVFVTDSTLCSDSAVFSITSPGPFVVTPAVQNTSCGLSNGTIGLTVNGATPPYTFLWSGGQTTSSISGLAVGNYTVTVSDSAGCDTSFTVQVIAQSGPVIVLDSIRNVRCFGSSSGRIYISVLNGSSPFTFLWNDGNTNEDRLNLTAGVYTVTVTDFGGCTNSLSITISQNPQLSATFTAQQATCNQSNGSATVTPGGGVGPYILLWETGSSATTISNLPAGFYAVTITDNVGCQFIDSVAVSNSGAPLVQLQNQILPLCFGNNNGTLIVNISGGTIPYTTVWSNGDIGLTADSLSAGSYTVSVTDGVGCIAAQTFTLGQPVAVTVQLQSTGSNCGQSNGTVTAIPSGGTGNFGFLWSNGATTATVANLSVGLYTVTVTDQNACSMQDTIRVKNINGPQLNINQVTNVSCFGGSNGAINVSVSGGAGGLQYSWSSGQTTQDLNNIPASNYTLIVTDNAGCKDTLITTVSEPSALVNQITVLNASCGNTNGAASVITTGGISGYSYLWSTGSNNDSIVNVLAGTYTVTVTDNNGCTLQTGVLINNTTGPAVILLNNTAILCPGDSSGQLSVGVFSGTAPFSFLWSNGSVTQDLINVVAGIYTLTVTDSNACVTLFTDTIEEPPPIIVTATISDPSCNLSNGIIAAQAAGGTPGYNYLWSTTNASSTISGLNTGTYTLTVTDLALCRYDTSFSIINTGVPAINVIAVDSVSCFGDQDGSIDIDVSGGVGPYLYTWVNTSQTTQDVSSLTAGNYQVVVTDDEGCTTSQAFTVYQPSKIVLTFPLLQNAGCGQSNGALSVNASGGIPGYSLLWSTGSQNDSLSNLSSGSYTVTVTDSKGCSVSNIANISNLSGPSIVNVDSLNISCNGGTDGLITITATGVSVPLTYSWAGLTDTDSSLSNLTAGSYTVTVTDALGCVLIRTITLTEPQPFLINSVIPQNNPPYNISCFGLTDGEINLSVNGGTAPYKFVWSNGAISQNLSTLPAGVVTVFITDDNNCTTSQSFTLTQPQELVAVAGTDIIICGESNIALFADTPSIGIGYWQVVNSSNVITFSDSTSPASDISNLAVGDNVLLWTITDGICSDSDQIVITVASEIDAICGTDRKVCSGEVNLNATRPQFGYGYWTTFNPGVSIEDSSKAYTAVSNLNFGDNIFMWTVVNGTCRDSAEVNIFRRDSLDCLPRVQLPTAFSPNFDGSNDYLIIKGLEEYPDNEIMIYNRWGQIVFKQSSYRNDWYGTDNEGYPLADGTYFVILKVKFIDKVFNSYIDLRR